MLYSTVIMFHVVEYFSNYVLKGFLKFNIHLRDPNNSN